MLYRQAFDPFVLFDDGFCAAEVGVGLGCLIAALGIAPLVVMLDGSADLEIKVAGHEVVFKEDSVIQGLMLGLNLALGLGMRGRAPNMAHPLGLDIVRQLPRDLAGAIVAKQARFMTHMGLIAHWRCRCRRGSGRN